MKKIASMFPSPYSVKRMAGIISILVLVLMFSGCGRESPRQILLISIDTLRADHLTSYGYSRSTSPHIKALAEESLLYEHAYPAGCWTMPSHMSLLTGTLPSRHGVNMDWASSHSGRYRVLNPKISMISSVLKTAQREMATLKFARLPGNLGFKRGFDLNMNEDPFHSENEYLHLVDLIRKHQGKDFFLFVHTWMVHAPYSSARFFLDGKISQEDRKYIFNLRDGRPPTANRDLAKFLKRKGWFTPRTCMALYDGGIFRVDQGIGRLMAELKRLGMFRNMMVVLVSDHGEHFAEHVPKRFYDDHGKDFYEEYVHVPLIVKYPRSRHRGRVKQPVSLIDVMPTILSHYGMAVPAEVQGRVLPRMDTRSSAVPVISEAISLPGMERKMIRLKDLKLILTMRSPLNLARANWKRICERKLFHLTLDPGEMENRIQSPTYHVSALRMEKLLIRSLLRSSR